MNSQTKIHLSKLETELIQNKEWILTKRAIINKVYLLFGEMHKIYKKISEEETYWLVDSLKNYGGKISKGENYEGFPYVILDYPASFSRKSVFAVRTMFWWGNFLSISLHLSGEEFRLKNNFSKMFLFLRKKKFYVCVNDDEWQHNFEPSNYAAVSGLEENKFNEIANRNFIKISKNLELNKWNEVPEFLEETFKEIIDFLKISFPSGEKDLSPGFPKAGFDL